MQPASLLLRASREKTSLEVLQAHDELRKVRSSVELYKAQPIADAPEDFAASVRSMLASAPTLAGSPV